jgi:PAS domain S-box-containing protein
MTTSPDQPTQEPPRDLEWLRVTLASISDAVITTDNEGRVTFLNATAEALTGWTQENAAGQPLEAIFVILNEETRHTVENPVARALREGLAVGLANHTLLIAKDATERLIDGSAAPIRNGQGQVAGYVLVFRDMTQPRWAERQMQNALAYAEDIIATVREPLIVLDAELRVQRANRSFYQTFGVTEAETVDRLVYELGNGQWNIPQLRELLEEVLPQNHAFEDFEVEHDFPVIGLKSMLLNARQVQKSHGADEGLILLAIEDITERQRTAARLLDSELRYRRLFETARDAILILDGDTGKIIDANSFIREMTGYDQDYFLGKELWQIGLFEDIEASQRAFQELQREEYIRYQHLPLQTRDRCQVEVEFISNVYQVDGRRIIQCNIRDVTERRRMEREIEQQAQELVDLDRRKDEFLAMLSHELRNPLAPIINALHLLRVQRNETGVQREVRAVIERQTAHLTLLVDDLLEVSRMTTGRIHLHREWVAVSSIVEQAVETVRPMIEQRRHDLTVLLPPEPLWLYADAVRGEQVVVNLLTNAAKYTDEGGRIWLSVQQQGDEVVLRVRDTGIGITPEFLPHIFDLFMQAERTLARAQGGLGVGLSLVRALVELHDGKVEAHSAGLGQGSEFIVYLPVVPSPTRHPAPPPIDAATPTPGSLRVLFVDDNADMRVITLKLLESYGYQVRTAHDGPSALETAMEYGPDVMLLDIGLPEMDGYEVAKRMRQDSSLQNILLVAVTGYGLESDRLRSQEAGFDHHLVKPVDFNALLELLATIAEARATGPQGKTDGYQDEG